MILKASAASLGLVCLLWVPVPASADTLQACERGQAIKDWELNCPDFDVFRPRGNLELDGRVQGRVRGKPYDLVFAPAGYDGGTRREFGGVFDGRRIAFVAKGKLKSSATGQTDMVGARGWWGGKRFACRVKVEDGTHYRHRSDLCTVTTLVPLLGAFYFTYS